MPPSILLTMRTADRSPKPNYLGSTVRDLIAKGVAPKDIHISATHPDVTWMSMPSEDVPVDVPVFPLTPNQNGLSLISRIANVPYDWIVMTEDDLEWCDDPIGSMARWLEEYERPGISVYRFFAFDQLKPWQSHAATAPTKEMRGSQAVAMRAADALRFKAWAEAHPLDWRPKSAPFQDQPHTGFDKLIGYWALRERGEKIGLVSVPFFCRHIGTQSSLHPWGKRMDHQFAGPEWSYGGAHVQV